MCLLSAVEECLDRLMGQLGGAGRGARARLIRRRGRESHAQHDGIRLEYLA